MNRRHFVKSALSTASAAMAASGTDIRADAKDRGGSNSSPGPPMGWNSFDAYDSRITEDEFIRCAEVIRDELLPQGWDTVVVFYILKTTLSGIGLFSRDLRAACVAASLF
jgi:hypothetical protein